MSSQKQGQWKPGAIRSINLINFMCHETFEITFGPRVNFIIGPNGSGKSALLTAIVSALGGRASITSRAKKNDDFILYGAPHAKITVVLHNYDKVWEMKDAYKPEEYGKVITIEKSIFRDSISKLALKDEQGKKISERKHDLDDMLDFFGILINNPICILNQEVSKSFLHSKKPEDKFQLFMRATNLEQIEENYDEAKKSCSSWDETNQSKVSAWRILDREYIQCKEQTKYIMNRHQIRDQAVALEQEYLWANIRDAEQARDKIDRENESLTDKIQKTSEQMEKHKVKVSEIDQDVQAFKDEIKESESEFVRAEEKLADIRKRENDARMALSISKHKLVKLEGELERRKKNKDSLEESIAAKKAELQAQNALDQINEDRKTRIETLEKKLAELKAQENSTRFQRTQLNSSMTPNKIELNKAQIRRDQVINEIARTKADLRRFRDGNTNNLKRYGDWMVRLVAEIDDLSSKGRFKKRPMGPLGYHLKLKNPDVAKSLEIQLGRNAFAFTCDNRQDMTVLLSLMRRILPRLVRQPLVIIRPFGPRHNIERFRARHQVYKTLIDYLEIESDEIYNALLDRTGLESILFIPDYKDAENLMINPATIPKNTRCAYTKEASCLYPRTASGGYKCISHSAATGSLFLESNAAIIHSKEKDLSTLEAHLQDVQEKFDVYTEKLLEQREELKSCDDQIINLKSSIRGIEKDLTELQTTFTVEPQVVTALEGELRTLLDKIAELERIISEGKKELEMIDQDLKIVMADKEDVLKLKSEYDKKRDKIMEQIENSEKTKSKLIEMVRNCEKIIGEKTKLHESNKQNLRVLQERMKTLEEMVTLDERPDAIRPTNQVLEEKQKLQALLAAEEQNMPGEPAEILEKLNKRIEEIERMKNIKELNDDNFRLSTKAIHDRQEGLIALKQFTTVAVNTTFSIVMKTLKMDGRLDIYLDDYIERGRVVKKAKTLEMHLDTCRDSNSITDKENRMSDARSLSGGERSFSTVAFVLALWHHCSSPFKLMDEIDVFMDMVTRRVSYNALIRFAEVSPASGQFLFFSPLELPKFEDTEVDIKVFEMPPIIRQQTQR